MNFAIAGVFIYEIIKIIIEDNEFLKNFCPELKKEECSIFMYDFYMNVQKLITNNTIDFGNIDKDFLTKYDFFFRDKSPEEIGEKINDLINKIQPLIEQHKSGDLYYSMFQQLIEDKQKMLQDIKYYPDSDKIAVIIDPRYDSLMEAVIINFMYFMNPKGWNLLIVSHGQYKDEIMQKIPNSMFWAIDESLITYDSNNIPNISLTTYNKILLDREFWNKIPASTIAIFQKDCIMYKMFDDIYNDYDYSGANYYGHSSYHYGGINGGFCIRKKSAMIECIDKVTWELIIRYNTILHNFSNENISNNNNKPPIFSSYNEDVFFTCACEILKKLVPDVFHRNKLAIETDYNTDVSIYHGWNKNYHNIEKAKELLKNSPLFGNYIK